MSNMISYDPSAARTLISDRDWQELQPRLAAARDEMFHDLDALHAGAMINKDKLPLDAGFIDYPQRLLGASSPLHRLWTELLQSAAELRDQVDRLVVLGIGGSYMGLRALFEAVGTPYHNELSREERGGVPRLYFEGDNLDNDSITGLLTLLRQHCRDPKDLAQRWGIVVISKSGGTLETAAAFRIFREELERYYGADSDEARSLVVPITGDVGKLRSFSEVREYRHVFPVPDGVGGRFSVLTPVGLFPAAVLGIDCQALIEGAVAMTDLCRIAPPSENPVLDYVAVGHLLERDKNVTIRVLSTWGKRLEAVGLWYDQLLAESLGKHERGATPLTVVNTRDLHSRGQQHQEGRRDKLITNVIVEEPAQTPVTLPKVPEALDQDGLNRLAGKPVPELMSAAIQGTNKAYADVDRPTADIRLPRLNEHTLGQLLQMLMLATVVEGRLIGINPYGQPGVEDYKQNMGEILFG